MASQEEINTVDDEHRQEEINTDDDEFQEDSIGVEENVLLAQGLVPCPTCSRVPPGPVRDCDRQVTQTTPPAVAVSYAGQVQVQFCSGCGRDVRQPEGIFTKVFKVAERTVGCLSSIGGSLALFCWLCCAGAGGGGGGPGLPRRHVGNL